MGLSHSSLTARLKAPSRDPPEIQGGGFVASLVNESSARCWLRRVAQRCLSTLQTTTGSWGRGASGAGGTRPDKDSDSLSAKGLLIYTQGQGEASPNSGTSRAVSYSSPRAAIWPWALSAFRIDGTVLIFLEVNHHPAPAASFSAVSSRGAEQGQAFQVERE